MMFQTYQGVVLEQANQIYLRPETAQGIFINFKHIQRTTERKCPLVYVKSVNHLEMKLPQGTSFLEPESLNKWNWNSS
jgi:hypothetical protein